jgi:hypothetical protein
MQPAYPTSGFATTTISSIAVSGPVELPEPFITAGTANLLFLVADLLALASPTRVRNDLLTRFLDDSKVDLWLATTQWSTKQLSSRIPWPRPPLNTFWEYDLFMSGWRRAIETSSSLGPPSGAVVFFAYAWIDLGTAVLTGSTPVGLPAGTVPSRKDWGLLRGQVEALLKQADGDDLASVETRTWIARLATLVAPELIGDHPEAWEIFYNKPDQLSTLWKDQGAQHLKNIRDQWLNKPAYQPLISWFDEIRTWDKPGLQPSVPDQPNEGRSGPQEAPVPTEGGPSNGGAST